MRRSAAPSQILKQSQSPSPSEVGGKRRSCSSKKRRYKDSDDDDDDDVSSTTSNLSSPGVVRSPLSPLLLLNSPSSSASSPGIAVADYERLIQQILSRPFKIPIKNYTGPCGTKSLGYRKNAARRALHDPEEEGALILWAPPELSATEILSVKEDKMQVRRDCKYRYKSRRCRIGVGFVRYPWMRC